MFQVVPTELPSRVSQRAFLAALCLKDAAACESRSSEPAMPASICCLVLLNIIKSFDTSAKSNVIKGFAVS